MPKKKRKSWQAQGFKNYREYQLFTQKAKLQSIFQECLQEADEQYQAIQEKRHQETTNRLKYHNLRLQELSKFPVVSERTKAV